MLRLRIALTILIVSSSIAQADNVSYIASGGHLASSASFNFSGDTVTITLPNNAQVSPDGPWLIPLAAHLKAGSSVLVIGNCHAKSCSGETDGRIEWRVSQDDLAFLTGTNQAVANFSYPEKNTPAGKAKGRKAEDLTDFGDINFKIVDAGFGPFSGDTGVTGVALVRNHLWFILTGTKGRGSSDLANLFFPHGTVQPHGPHVNGSPVLSTVPEPASVVLFGTVACVAIHLLRKRQTA